MEYTDKLFSMPRSSAVSSGKEEKTTVIVGEILIGLGKLG